MTCREIEKMLPPYLDGLLSPEEKTRAEEHLKSCPLCLQDMANLKKTGALLKDLGEVEPPPFFEQRIMARIREENEKKRGFFRKLFFPLRIKVPVQVLATLFIAIFAFYVYQKGEPEMKQLTPFTPPLTGSPQNRAGTESIASPPNSPGVRQDKPSSSGDLAGKNPLRQKSPPTDHQAKQDSGMLPPQAPAWEAQPPAAYKDRETYQDRTEASGKALDKPGNREVDKGFAAPLPEQKRKEKAADGAAAGGVSRQAAVAPVPARSLSSETVTHSTASLTLRVRDPRAALRILEEHIRQVNGRVILRQSREGSESLKMELASQNVASFLKRLEAMGPVDPEQPAAVFPEGTVTLSIKIDPYP